MPGECLAIIVTHLDFLSKTIARARPTDGRTGPGSGDKRENIAPVRKIAGHCPQVSGRARRNARPRVIVEEQCHLLSGTDKQPSLTSHRVQVNNFTSWSS